MPKLLEVKSLNFKYGAKKVLEDISFSVNPGEIVSIIGPMGCGKTTLLKLIAGLIPSNSILLGYGYLNRKNREDLKKISCVFEDEFTFLFDSVYQELSFPLENLCYASDVIDKKILELTSFFDCLDLLDKLQEDLKEEEKSLLNIMLALIVEPSLVVLDNAFLKFRKSAKEKFMKNFRKYCKEKNIAVIYSSSNLEDILISDTTYVLNQGSIVIYGDTVSVLYEDDALKKLGLELPFSAKLSNMLIFYEILDKVYIDKERLVEALWK